MNSGDCVETREEGIVTATGYYVLPTSRDALGFPCAGDAKFWLVECTRSKRTALPDQLSKYLIFRLKIEGER